MEALVYLQRGNSILWFVGVISIMSWHLQDDFTSSHKQTDIWSQDETDPHTVMGQRHSFYHFDSTQHHKKCDWIVDSQL